MRRGGWYGHSREHSLAAKGVRIYAAQKLVDPIFFARKNEEEVPLSFVLNDVRQGKNFHQMRMRYRADPEHLRQRGIRAIEMRDADDTLSTIDRQGVDMTKRMMQESPQFKERVYLAIKDPQKSSFLYPEKVRALEGDYA